MNQEIKSGLLFVVTMLAIFGGSEILNDQELNNAYVCESTGQLAIFQGSNSHPDPLSTSGVTGYWIDETGANRISRCSDGWVKLTKYINDKKGTITSDVPVGEGMLQYKCNTEKCVVIE